jgi:acyl carrier protein
MTRPEIRQKIVTILTEDFQVSADKINDESSFRGSLGLDSLDIVDFIVLLQKDFGYQAPLDSYRNIENLKMLVDFVESKQKK